MTLSAWTLAGRPAAVDRKTAGGYYPYYQFVQGLAEYRQGQFEKAITTLRGEAAKIPGPTPRLVLAMALHRNGQQADARKTFALAVSAYDWRPQKAVDHDGWIRHALRREAEHLILPDLPAFLKGDLQTGSVHRRGRRRVDQAAVGRGRGGVTGGGRRSPPFSRPAIVTG